MKTRQVIIAASLALAMGAGGAERKWQEASQYGASFEEYAVDEPLSTTKGTKGGAWDAASTGAETYAGKSPERSFIDFSSTAATPGIRFLPTEFGSREIKQIVSSAFFVSTEKLIDPPAGSRAGFTLYAPDEESEPTFVGWTAKGWQLLSAEEITPKSGMWYAVSIRFFHKKDGVVRVEYGIKKDDRCVTLKNEAGESWFDVGDVSGGKIVNAVGYFGGGMIEYLHGGDEPRGMKFAVNPFFRLVIDETVTSHGTGLWDVLDDETGERMARPAVIGESYAIKTGNKAEAADFHPQKDTAAAMNQVEVAVRFEAPNDNEDVPDGTIALMRVVETDTGLGEPAYRFACLSEGAWVTNTTVAAELNADYTVAVGLDEKAGGSVSYKVKKGRGGEAGTYAQLVAGSQDVSGHHTIAFDGEGKVYEIKSAMR